MLSTGIECPFEWNQFNVWVRGQVYVIRIRQAQVSRYHLGMTTRRELRSIRIQLAKEEGVLRELKRGADIGGLGNASTAMARDIEHSEREVELLRAKLKRLKVRV